MHPILANAGGPLVLTTIAHLYLLNLFLGVIEGAFIAERVRGRKRILIPAMIAANFASSWIGYNVLPSIWYTALAIPGMPPPLIAAQWLIPLMFFAAFVVTLGIESPLAWWFTRRTSASRRKRAFTIFWSQFGTYALLAWLYTTVSQTSAHRTLSVVPAAELAMEAPAGWMYYIDGGALYKSRLDGSSRTRIAALDADDRGRDDRLIWLSQEEPGQPWELRQLRRDGDEPKDPPDFRDEISKPLARGEAGYPVAWFPEGESWSTAWEYEYHGRKPACIRGDTPQKWLLVPSWYEEYGAGVTFEEAVKYEFAFALPFDAWMVRSMSFISGEFVVYDFGSRWSFGANQVLLHHLPTRRVAIIARGISPAVVLDESPTED